MAKMACAKCGMTMKKGGAKPKKMATGGVTLTQKGAGYAKATTGGTNGKMGIYGMPQENMGTSGQYGKMAKGGAFAPNRAVQASCKNGMVRDENGRCVMERKMAKGGATKVAYMEPLKKAQDGRVVKPKMGVSWINEGIKKGNNTPTDTGNPMADGFNRGIASVKDFGKGVSEGFKASVKGVGNMINTVANSSTRNKNKTPNTPKHKKGGMTKAKKFAALAPPYNKATAADRIAGAKKNKRK